MAEAGEEFEGVLGVRDDQGGFDDQGLIRFGGVGAEEVAADDDVLIILAPQSMVGASVIEPLSEMAAKAVAQGSALILINPLLQDRPSSGGVMSVRGRSDRMAFAASFEEVR